MEKGQDPKQTFSKKLGEALSFLQEEVDAGARFVAIDPEDRKAPHISLAAEIPKYVVRLNRYFEFAAANLFNNVTQANGRAIKASAMMEFKGDPEEVLGTAAADLRAMQCTIFYKRCQHVATESNIILIGAPNSVGEEIIKEVFQKELKEIENKGRGTLEDGN